MHLPVSGRRGQVGAQVMKQGEITLAYPADGFKTVRANLTGDLGDLTGRVTVRCDYYIEFRPFPRPFFF